MWDTRAKAQGAGAGEKSKQKKNDSQRKYKRMLTVKIIWNKILCALKNKNQKQNSLPIFLCCD